MQREALYLRDIVDPGEEIATYLIDTDELSFLADSLKQSAVAFQLSILGEAIANISDKFKQKYPDVEWSAARSLRNIIAHRYFAINWTIIWETAVRDVPVLQAQVAAILEYEYPDFSDS